MSAPRAPRARLWRRRGWLLVAAGVLAAGLLLLGYGMLWEPRQLIERDHALRLDHWPTTCDGLRVDVVADLHTGSWANGLDNLDRIVDRLQRSDADIVLLAGDYVILLVPLGRYVDATKIAARLAPLAASKPVYAVLGNHDWWKDGPRVGRAFARAGIRMIDNASAPVRVGDCRFHLAGLGDELEGAPDVGAAWSGIPPAAPVIALMHEPATLRRLPADVALAVSGHTHGGQINPFSSPWRTAHFAPDSHWLRGQVRDGERLLFVSPGIGTSILPVRIGVLPEISRLTLRSTATAAAR